MFVIFASSLLVDIVYNYFFIVTLTTKLVSNKKSMKAANPVTCKVCEYAMQYLDSILSNNATEAEVKAALDSLCGHLPESIRAEVR